MRHSTRRFPRYRHRPGITPHPERDPAGHSHGEARPAPVPLGDDNWTTHEGYRFGVNLFNAGYYWEAHVEWEALWQCASTPMDRLFLQALVQLAASMVKLREGSWTGASKLATRAAEKFERVYRRGDVRFGLGEADLTSLCERLKQASEARSALDEAPLLVLPPGGP